MVAVLEGGYNTDYLGQHASGVVKALLDIEPDNYGIPTDADDDVMCQHIDDINGDDALDWAKENVDETKKFLKPYWSSL